MVKVIFNEEEFRSSYPQCVKDISDGQLRQAFNHAVIFLANNEKSPVPYDPDKGINDRKTLLHLLVAHQITMFSWSEKGQSGPVSSATEGSVSVSFALPSKASDSYFTQSPYGNMFLRALKPYIAGGRYIACIRHHPWG